MKIVFNSIYYLFVLCLVCVGVLLLSTMTPISGNIKVKIVKSGSMEPAIRTGSIVIIKAEPTYHVGDIITFGLDTKTQIPTTHRIVAISTDPSPIYSTKGDANDASDPSNTRFGDIHGKVITAIPYLGFILDFARKPLGFGLLVGVPATLIILEELGKIWAEIRRLRLEKKAVNASNEKLPLH